MTGDNSKKRNIPEDPASPENEHAKVQKVDASVKEKKHDDHSTEKQSPSSPTTVLSREELSSRFPSLLLNENSSIPFLGLYFAASWCPDVQAATPAVTEFALANKNDICIVYIASDSTEEEMKAYLPSCMVAVPFENEDERANLKRHFGVCASKERESLGISSDKHKFGIPTLIVLDQKTGQVVTNEGVDDIIKSNGEQSVIEKWKATMNEQVASSDE